MHRQELLQKIRESGWKILRQEGNHYVVEKDGNRSGFAVMQGRELPRETVQDIFKKLKINKGDEKVSKFFKKREGKLAPIGTYGYELYNARAAKRVSAQDLGRAVGLSGSAIILYEANKGVPKPEIQEKMATLLQWPALHVIKSTTQTITDAAAERIGDTVPVATESGSVENREAMEVDRKRGWQAREARRQRRLNRLTTVKTPMVRRGRKPGRKPGKISTQTPRVTVSFDESVTHEQFNDAMLTIRTFVNQMEKRAEKWTAIKDLIKDEE